jgi:hypothetical protein
MSDLRRRCGEDRGYAVIMTALLLVPLMGFAGFAVDVGAWYARASELQRAADAAALAGVVWQPDFTTAEAAARAEASRNGFTHGVDGIEVNVTNSASNQLQVQIIDSDADMFFAGLFLDDVAIGRQAVSEYIDSVPLGSPRNHFGTNDLLAVNAENFSAGINGSCAPREQGDHRSVHFMNNWDASSSSYNDILCPTAAGGPGPDVGGGVGNTLWNANPFYEGAFSYAYHIDVPAGNAAPIDLFIRDPNYDPTGPIDNGGTWPDVTTNFRLRAPDGTRFDDTDNPIYTGCTSGRATGGTFTYASQTTDGTTSLFAGDGSTWDLFCRIPANAGGRYILEVGTQAFEPRSMTSNNYAILAHNTASGTFTCDTRTDPNCPSVVAVEWMSITAELGGAVADFFLAEIGDEHEGKDMRITLFDPGEGSNSLQILNPDGNPVSFTWSTTDGVYSGAGNSLTVSGACGAACPAGNASTSQFSDRFVEVIISLPTDFGAAYATADRWWRISYNTGAAPTDRTSWSVEIIGDPVRLLE